MRKRGLPEATPRSLGVGWEEGDWNQGWRPLWEGCPLQTPPEGGVARGHEMLPSEARRRSEHSPEEPLSLRKETPRSSFDAARGNARPLCFCLNFPGLPGRSWARGGPGCRLPPRLVLQPATFGA